MKSADGSLRKNPLAAHMSKAARQAKIIELIRRNKKVTVNDLAEFLESSKETIRRDLTALENSGKVRKFHGGATLPETLGEGPLSERMGEHAAAKMLIGTMAREIVSAGETVFMDTGSTSIYFAEALAEIQGLTVITNSVDIARTISSSEYHSDVFLLGGQFRNGNRQTTGSLVLSQIHLFSAHHVILTVGALDSHRGVMDYSVEEAQIAQVMIEQAETVTVIADSSKFNQIASFKVCDLEQIDNLICEQRPPEELVRSLQEGGVNILIVTG
jgi:DeoR family glycerol-3-phosphate regulon repressor